MGTWCQNHFVPPDGALRSLLGHVVKYFAYKLFDRSTVENFNETKDLAMVKRLKTIDCPNSQWPNFLNHKISANRRAREFTQRKRPYT